MDILGCGYSENQGNSWRFIFDVENVEEAYIQKAKEFDKFYENEPPCFVLEVLYNEKNDTKVLNPASLVYIDFNGDACLFDYWLATDQQKYILECIREEINYA